MGGGDTLERVSRASNNTGSMPRLVVSVSAVDSGRAGVSSAPLTVQQVLDNTTFRRRHLVVLVIAFLTLMLEGIELQLWAFLYPQIIQDWGTTIATITVIVTAGLAFLTIGSLVAGPVAERAGLRPVIIVGVIIFGIGTLAGAAAPNEIWLTVTRCIACFGLGVVMPLVVALVGEVMPQRLRTALVSVAFSGFIFGPVVVGVTAGRLLPVVGWHGLLVCGGVAAAVLLIPILFGLPESPGYLSRRRESRARLERTLRQFAPRLDYARVAGPVATGKRSSREAMKIVLAPSQILRSAIIWLCYFTTGGIAYILISYLPLFLGTVDIDTDGAGVMVAALGLSGGVGALTIGFLMAWLGRFSVVGAFFLAGALSLWITAAIDPTLGVLVAGGAVFGFTVTGLNAGLNALSTTEGIFPPQGRATGISWMHGFSKTGSLVSGVVGGAMLSAGWKLPQIYVALGIPLVVAAFAVAVLSWEVRRRTRLASAGAETLESSRASLTRAR
jgi:AAHS family 4-hydroxybenzoate transporter-like MFS transporter